MNSAQSAEVLKKEPVSVRKIEANRRNSLKSTGPKTERGKANSRKNAIKHGLFIRQMESFLIEEEEDDAFITFHKRLWEELRPLGPREESEVAYIAISWLRLDRLWRYENAKGRLARHRIDQQSERGIYGPYAQVAERRKIMSLLHSAREEAKRDGHVSQQLLSQIFEEDPAVKGWWPYYQEQAETSARKNIREIAKTVADERKIGLSEAKLLLSENPESVPEFTRFVALDTLTNIIDFRWTPWWEQSLEIERTAVQLAAIPDEVVEKVIRYGNAIERQLSRAYARLDRLQSRRRGESVPAPLVDVYLTR